jgi:malate/lactate dehydrogenase
MSKAPWTVCITGAAGQIGYALLPHICSGKTFGPDQPIKLHLLDLNIEGVQTALGGVKFELEDSTYPLLKGVVTTGDAKVIIARRLANARLLFVDSPSNA